MNPHRLTFGFAYSFPFAQLAILATMIGIPFAKERKNPPLCRELILMLGLWLVFLLSSVYAINPDGAWDQFIKVSKILLSSILMLMLLQDRKRIQLLLYVIAGSIGFYGLKGGIFSIVTGGQNMVLGPPESFIEGNTNLGLALTMILPILFYLAREVEHAWFKIGLRVVLIFSLIATVITYSRGAIIGLMAVCLILFFKSKAKMILIILALIATPVILSVLPLRLSARVKTLQDYEQDASALARIRAWQVSYRLAKDKPVLGGGFEPFSVPLYHQYLNEEEIKTADSGTGAHSIFFQILAEHGFLGFAFYVGLLGSTLWTLLVLSRKARNNQIPGWMGNYAEMLQVSLVGYVGSGAFLSMCYFDLYYGLVAVAIILKKLASDYERKLIKEGEPAGEFA